MTKSTPAAAGQPTAVVPAAGRSPADRPLADAHTTVADLKHLVEEFVAERDWAKYHTPRNVAVSVVLEAGELLEHFQWSPPASEEISPDKRREIGEEMADVLAYLLSLANVLDLDLAAALEAKMRKNRRKYPVERFQGRWEKAKKDV